MYVSILRYYFIVTFENIKFIFFCKNNIFTFFRTEYIV